MNRRDSELLSAYLDGELKASDSKQLEARLKSDPELASVLNNLRTTRTLLHKLPSRKAPRNFTLTRKMVGQSPPLPRTYPIFRLATVVATLLFFFSFGINSFGSQLASQPLAYGIGGSGGGGGADESFAQDAPAMEMESAPAAEAPMAPAEEPAMEEPAAPAPAAEPEALADTGETTLDSASLPTEVSPTDDSARVVETPSSKAGEAENVLEGEQVQVQREAPRIISSSWQTGLIVIALAGMLLMSLMRYIAVRRWK